MLYLRWITVAVPFNTSPINGIKVLIVSSDDETLDGTCDYLSRVGASPRGAKKLSDAIGAAQSAQAVIFFADDYAKESAGETLRELRARRTKVIIVVSDQVEVFTSGPGESDGPVTVLRRPTWGWMLLDAIRARLGSAPVAEP
jgi:DNA-binding response OmpR family regulator